MNTSEIEDCISVSGGVNACLHILNAWNEAGKRVMKFSDVLPMLREHVETQKKADTIDEEKSITD